MINTRVMTYFILISENKKYRVKNYIDIEYNCMIILKIKKNWLINQFFLIFNMLKPF